MRVDQYQDFRPGFWKQPFLEFRRAADHLFDEFFRNIQLQMGDRRIHWRLPTDFLGFDQPRVDMEETDENIMSQDIIDSMECADYKIE